MCRRYDAGASGVIHLMRTFFSSSTIYVASSQNNGDDGINCSSVDH